MKIENIPPSREKTSLNFFSSNSSPGFYTAKFVSNCYMKNVNKVTPDFSALPYTFLKLCNKYLENTISLCGAIGYIQGKRRIVYTS